MDRLDLRSRCGVDGRADGSELPGLERKME